MKPKLTINNKYNLTSIYLAKDADKQTWADGRKKAIDRGLSMTQYLLSLIRKDTD